MRRKQLKVLFGLYCLLMLWLLLGQRLGHSAHIPMQLKPFATIGWFVRVLGSRADQVSRFVAWKNLLGNVIMFIPLGFFVPLLWEKNRNFLKHLGWMFAIILAVELLQYVTGLGTCDVDDLILNILGTSFGWLAWKLCPKIVKS